MTEAIPAGPEQVLTTRSVAALSLRNVSKVFGGTHALDRVSLEVAAGEVHGLVGENGSGKSTLIKVLSGYHVPEPGATITIAGREVAPPLSAGTLRSLGVRFVHQDLGLAPSLTVAENLFVDELGSSRWKTVSRSADHRRAREVFAPFGRVLDPAAKVGSLSPADQAHLAVVRAVSQIRQHHVEAEHQPGLLVLDEVTAFLPSEERQQLFALIREIIAQGDSVLFVSHYLDEVLEITSRVSVLRDGEVVHNAETATLDSDRLVELIIGRALRGQVGVDRAEASNDAVATVTGLRGSLVDGVDFSLRRGEVLGVTGLLGSGFEQVPSLLFGAVPASGGELRLGDAAIDLTTLTPERATQRGLALVPGDRASAGAAGSLTVAENLTLQILHRYRRANTLQRRRLQRDARALLIEYDVRPPDPAAKLSTLSGGNQQKVILAKWLTAGPSLLLLDEPTLGIDVGSREEILLRIRAVAREGVPVICATSDPDQLTELCDRVLIFGRGSIVAELWGESLNKDTITERCYSATVSSGSARQGEYQ
ncbi:ATP-binding cassette domain-containing protein [Acidimicrobiaceae bacterium USS-CC1]|uniref:ATP-binding cassette domain-containing protein n=1 Tax=Acidiferrimicrobium australe TaxID=2664430 RepID=A0ABW9QNS6_9ACTN|nr:ATP-binding cassette domain-containing protein [Acidiferrimicrobium australe]